MHQPPHQAEVGISIRPVKDKLFHGATLLDGFNRKDCTFESKQAHEFMVLGLMGEDDCGDSCT